MQGSNDGLCSGTLTARQSRTLVHSGREPAGTATYDETISRNCDLRVLVFPTKILGKRLVINDGIIASRGFGTMEVPPQNSCSTARTFSFD